MQNKSSHKELPFDVEDDQYLHEVTLKDDGSQNLNDNVPLGFEDFLYETWKESRICNQDEMKGNIDKLPESN
jgi:hypothetical protein